MAGSVTYFSWIWQAKLDRGCLLHIHFSLTSLMIRGQWAEGNNFLFWVHMQASLCIALDLDSKLRSSPVFCIWVALGNLPSFPKAYFVHLWNGYSHSTFSAGFFRGLRTQCTQCSTQCSSEALAWWLLWSPHWSWHIFKPNDWIITLISINVKLT